VSGSGEVAKDANDEVLSAKSLCHLRDGRPFHIERQGAMSLEQSLSGGRTKDEDVATNNPSEMDLDRSVRQRPS